MTVKTVSDIRSESENRDAIYHVVHLISDVLKPVLYAFDPGNHGRQLASDNGL